ncbi:hypothetical protein RHGRI_007442 [Rhododendron griersonianum]|uniref:Uncharacterized protein n=1 Tax=Rhododendron griersonianum TaxID=479676 RepID=A0AAV6KWS5_9ERIC|nr:hypothetical protein RHGRI_007442 [Rhododendron griersonianum]
MNANGFLSYLDGIVTCPTVEIQNSIGIVCLITQKLLLWRLIYLDKIKNYAKKLEAAGSPLGEDEIIFHTLRGLKKGFKGFKTVV